MVIGIYTHMDGETHFVRVHDNYGADNRKLLRYSGKSDIMTNSLDNI